MLEKEPSNGLGISGESYLVGQDHFMRSSSRFEYPSMLTTKVNTQSVELALQGKEGTAVIDDYRGIKVLSSFGKLGIPYFNWVIISEIDYKEATIPIYRIRNEIIFISIFIFLLVPVVIIILSRRITFPIQKLNQAAKEIGAGNMNVVLKTNLSDEIGELTESFNKMTQELKAERAKSPGSLIDGQESERQRLSRELHDSLGQSLIGLKLKYEYCFNHSSDFAIKHEKFGELAALFDSTIEETRRISNNLMPAALKEFCLFSALRNLCNQMAETTQKRIIFNTSGKDQDLPAKVKTYMFRIAQETITNTLKHAQAHSIVLDIEVKSDALKFRYEDDGVGFDKELASKGNTSGLKNMNDRVRLLSGSIQLDSNEGQGTKILIQIPLNQSVHE